MGGERAVARRASLNSEAKDEVARKAAPASGLRLAFVQRAGNAATTLFVQRLAGRTELLTAYRASVKAGNWQDVALRLNGFNREDIRWLAAQLSFGEAAHTRAAVLAYLAGWPEEQTILDALDAGRADLARVSQVYKAWDEAVAAASWKRAADVLNAMGQSDIDRRVGALSWEQKMRLLEAAGSNDRFQSAVDKSERDRVAAIFRSYDRAVASMDWPRAVQLLHGMSTEDIQSRLRALSFPELMAAKTAAGDDKVVSTPIEAEAKARPPAEKGAAGDGPEQVTEPVAPESELAPLPDLSGDARSTKDASAVAEWGGSAAVAAFMDAMAGAYAARKAKLKVESDWVDQQRRAEAQWKAKAKGKPDPSTRPVVPRPDEAALSATMKNERLAVLGKKWAKTLDGYKSNAEFSMFAVFARYFCSDVRQAALFDLAPKEFNWDHRLTGKTMKPGALDDVSFEKIISPGTGTDVKRIINDFIRNFPKSPACNFLNYNNHGTGDLQGKGYSLDIFLNGQPRDKATGFYPRELALQVINNVAHTAPRVGGDWRLCYNDFSVARAAQQRWGEGRVTYSGVHEKGPATNWHGPLNLHIHMDLVPTTAVEPGVPTSAQQVPATDPDTETK